MKKFSEFINEKSIDFEEALYQSGFEWDYENEKKKLYKIYLDGQTREDFLKQMKRLGKISFNGEKLSTGNKFELAEDII